MQKLKNGQEDRELSTISRREILGFIGFGTISISGCLSGGTESGEYPGGSVIVENQGKGTIEAWFKPADDSKSAQIMRVDKGKTRVIETYVSATEGESVTILGRLGKYGSESDNKSVEIYPSGDNGKPPQVVRMKVKDALGGIWEWSVEPGKKEDSG